NRATRLLTYLGEIAVNGHPLVKDLPKAIRRAPAPVPQCGLNSPPPAGTRAKLKQLGAKKFGEWILAQKPLLLTDTTFRDAHQSLLATRLRTHDLLGLADVYARHAAGRPAVEIWGGATFESALRVPK